MEITRRSPEGELPKGEGGCLARCGLTGLGASPSVAARQLPLGGSDFGVGACGGALAEALQRPQAVDHCRGLGDPCLLMRLQILAARARGVVAHWVGCA